MDIDFGHELQLPATIDDLDAAMDWAGEKLERIGCPRKIQNQIVVVMEELFVNICNYAYGEKTGYSIIRLDIRDQILFMQFEDSGIAFNPLEHKNPDVSAGIDDRQIGGLGIYLTTKWMDTVDYRRTDGKNILTISKSISAG